MPRFHSPLIEPDGRFSRIRLSDKEAQGPRVERVGPMGRRLRISNVDGEVGRLAPLSLSFSPAATSLNSGPFPPPELPGFLGTTSPSATRSGPACPSRASG